MLCVKEIDLGSEGGSNGLTSSLRKFLFFDSKNFGVSASLQNVIVFFPDSNWSSINLHSALTE